MKQINHPNPAFAACYDESGGSNLRTLSPLTELEMTFLPWLLLALSLGLLAFPFPAFYSRRHSYRALAELDIERRNASWWKTWRRVLRFPWHSAEILRGGACSWMAVRMLDTLAPVWPWYAEMSGWARPVIPLLAVHLSTVLSALLFRSPGKQPAPVFFTGTAVLTLLSPQIAVPSLLLAGAIMLAFKSLVAFLLVLGPLLLALGLVFDREPWPGVAGLVVAVAPVMIAAGRNREFVLPVHRSLARAGNGDGEGESEHKL